MNLFLPLFSDYVILSVILQSNEGEQKVFSQMKPEKLLTLFTDMQYMWPQYAINLKINKKLKVSRYEPADL